MKITNDWGYALEYEVHSSYSIPKSFGKGTIENNETIDIPLPETNHYRVSMIRSNLKKPGPGLNALADAVSAGDHISLSRSN